MILKHRDRTVQHSAHSSAQGQAAVDEQPSEFLEGCFKDWLNCVKESRLPSVFMSPYLGCLPVSASLSCLYLCSFIGQLMVNSFLTQSSSSCALPYNKLLPLTAYVQGVVLSRPSGASTFSERQGGRPQGGDSKQGSLLEMSPDLTRWKFDPEYSVQTWGFVEDERIMRTLKSWVDYPTGGFII